MKTCIAKPLLLASVAIIGFPGLAAAQVTSEGSQPAAPAAVDQAETAPAAADQVEPAGAAQEAEPPNDSQEDRVVVTGSRLAREGYEAPTPLAVVGAEEVQSSPGGNVASLLATMPVFSNSVVPNGPGIAQTPSNGLGGLNLVNIRGLGVNRSLVLLDGQRFVPTLTFGAEANNAVDISGLPQQLIASIETVTGGASAVYGSDAVGGVTNFILDKDFTGFKGDVSAGGTSYGDGYNWRAAFSGGTQFAGDRGHLLFSAEAYHKIQIKDSSNRDWDHSSYCVMRNPAYTATNGQPFQITVQNCGDITAPGGVIVTGPLAGTTFGEGGEPLPYSFGSPLFSPLMSGGSWQLSRDELYTKGGALDNGEKRQNVFGRLSYDLADNLSVAFTSSWSHSKTDQQALPNYFTGQGFQVNTDNAFIPASLRPALAGTTSFFMTHINGDIPPIVTSHDRYTLRNALSFDGQLDMLGSEWAWNAYYQYGKSRNSLNAYSISRSRYAKAYDAVLNTSGVPVCRVNADASTTNDDPACVPYNLFGTGVNGEAVLDYLIGRGHVTQTNTQEVYAASISGEPFSLWAGPVGIALSAEHRKESAEGGSVPGSLANDFFSGNYKPINGEDEVSEGAIEVLIPLAKGIPLIDSWDLELAGRLTEYQSSGQVETWKVGTTYSPFADLKIRANVSHDIRAGNLGELFAFAGAPFPIAGFSDPFTNTVSTIFNSSRGNPDLKPEEADNYGVGIVYQPSFASGLSLSVDYWRVEIEGLIAALTSAQAVQLCFNGNAEACSFITRSGAATIPGAPGTPYAGQLFAPITAIQTSYVNIATTERDGVDLSATYRMSLDDLLPSIGGDLTFRWDQNFYFSTYSTPGVPGGFPTKARPTWRAVASARYEKGPLAAGVTARFLPENAFSFGSDPQTIECTSGCPSQNALPQNFVTRNYVYREDAFFLDANVSYDLNIGGVDSQVYLNVRNLLNADPPLIPPGGVLFGIHQSTAGDDVLGRVIRLGLRFEM